MPDGFGRQVANEVARRAAMRLEILRRERPDLLAERLESLDPDVLSGILELTRLPPPLADREPRRRHVGIEGVDYFTDRLVLGWPGRAHRARVLTRKPDPASLDDDDLLATRRFIPETLPGNVLG
jgi:hypothetical protein